MLPGKVIRSNQTKVPGEGLLKMDVQMTIQVILCSGGGGENGDEELSGCVIIGDEGQT